MTCGMCKVVIIAFCLADMLSLKAESMRQPETPTEIVETTPPETAPQWQNGFRRYRVNGALPPYEWQWYLYGKLADRGLEWWYPYAVCQIYQESNWGQYSTNGQDHGLTQQKGIYWDGRAAQAGIPGADIWDPYAQMHVYVWMMAQYLAAAGGDTGRALSMYYLGYAGWSDEYVGHVTRWMDYLEVVE